MAPIRRLPVLQNASTADEDRPGWHWTVIGVVFIFSTWVPLAMLANWLGGRAMHRMFAELSPAEIANHLATAPWSTRFVLWLAVVAGPGLSFAISCWTSGALVGRFGTKAGPKEAWMAGAISALLATSLSLALTSWPSSIAGLVLLLPIGAGAAWIGGRFGLARRVASITRAPPAPGGRGSV